MDRDQVKVAHEQKATLDGMGQKALFFFPFFICFGLVAGRLRVRRGTRGRAGRRRLESKQHDDRACRRLRGCV